jgi:hypothetical protein
MVQRMINKKYVSALFTVILFIMGITPHIFADSYAFRSDTHYDEFIEMQEPLTSNQLARLSLLSSGLKGNQLNSYMEKLNILINESENEISSSMNTDEKAEALLLFLHNNVFTRYSLTQTSLYTVLDRGTYNCVSSAVLYMILTRHHGVFVEGIHVKDHAFCFIPGTVSGGTDVETTNEWGYDPGSRKEFQSSFASRTGYAYVSPGNYKARLRQGDRDMAGLILQNRIVELQKKNRHMEALTLAADRLALTGSSMAKQDYYNSVQNAAAQKNIKKDYLGGIELISTASLDDENFPDFLRATRSLLAYNACAEAVNKSDLAAAEEILFSQGAYILKDDKSAMESLILRRELEIRARGDFSADLLDEIAEAEAGGILSSSRASSLAAYHYSIKSEALSREGKHRDAYLFMLEAAPWIQKDREYKRLFGIVKNNTAIEYHNKIVALMNEGKQDEAKNLLEDGLDMIPRNSLLLKDKRKLDP